MYVYRCGYNGSISFQHVFSFDCYLCLFSYRFGVKMFCFSFFERQYNPVMSLVLINLGLLLILNFVFLWTMLWGHFGLPILHFLGHEGPSPFLIETDLINLPNKEADYWIWKPKVDYIHCLYRDIRRLYTTVGKRLKRRKGLKKSCCRYLNGLKA